MLILLNFFAHFYPKFQVYGYDMKPVTAIVTQKINTYYALFFVLGWLLEKEKKMKRIYPSKFGQYYSTKDEQEPRTPWPLMAALFAMLVIACMVGG